MRTLSALLLAASLVVTGCSSSSGDGSAAAGGGANAAGASYSQKITAAAGGTFTAAGATVVIPPGALAADTTLTLTVTDKAGQPNADTIAAMVFDFGPNGTTFLKPVSMTLDFTGTPPSGDVAKLAFLQGGAWVPLADSAVAGSKVTATTTHFTPFTIVFTPGGQTGGACGAFAACGGDVVGKWTYSAACVSLPAEANPYAAKCPTATMTWTVDVTGTVEFKADGTFDQAGTMTGSVVADVPKICSGGACPKSDAKTTWVDTGASCKGTWVPTTKSRTSTGTYTTAGSKLTVNPASAPQPSVFDYCVAGNSMGLLA
jgi:hypothetical protein